MSRFVIVDSAPEELRKGEVVIAEPDFLSEIKTAKNQPRPVGNRLLTTLNHLRTIVGNIGELYDPENFNAFSTIPLGHYVGIQYETLQDLSSKVIVPMFKKHYPQIFFRYLDKQIKSRPQGVELIYFVGSSDNAEVFLANGIDQDASEKK